MKVLMRSPALKSRLILSAFMLAILESAAWGQTTADYNRVGIEYFNAKQWDAAIEAFMKAYELAPDNPTVRRNLSNTYGAAADELAKAHDLPAAAHLVELAVSADPENPLPLIQLGSYYLQMENVADAIFRLEEAAELAPDNIDAHELLGDAYYRDNDLPSALAEWEFVREMDADREGLDKKIEKAYREDTVESGFRRSGSRHFQISFPPGTPASALNSVLRILEWAYRDLGKRFGVYPIDRIHVIIYGAGEFVQATAVGDHVGALYDGKIRIPSADQSGNPLSSQELQRRLNHEYVHVLVRTRVSDNVPWWLNEGLAETFSKEPQSIDWGLLQETLQNGSLFDLAELAGAQLEKQEPKALRLAYAQAHATVRVLQERVGQRGLNALLTALSDGMEPEDALKASTRRSYDLLQKEVVSAIRRAGQ